MLLLGLYVLSRALRGDRGPPFLRFLQNDRLINGNLRQGLILNTFSNPIYIVNEFSFYTRNFISCISASLIVFIWLELLLETTIHIKWASFTHRRG